MNFHEKSIFAGLLASCVSMSLYVVHTKGIEQLGNALSFFGTIATLIPAFNQVRTNRAYTNTIEIPTHPVLISLDKGLEVARRDSFMNFNKFDYRMIVLGLTLVSTGFFLSIVTSPNKPPTTALSVKSNVVGSGTTVPKPN